jgi:hypothetical protein
LVDEDDTDSVTEGYFEVAIEGIFPNKFAELYNFYKMSLMAEHWHKPFESDKKLSSKAKLVESLTSRTEVLY